MPGFTLARDDEALILRSAAPLRILSSAVVGGGFTRARIILNRHVSKHYDNPDPAADLRAFAVARGIHEPFVGLMTAVYLHKTQVVTLAEDDLRLDLVMTAGFSNVTAAGLSPPASRIHPASPGTINLILLIDGDLSPAAMVNAVITATEAKTHTLLTWGLPTPDGHPATGTSTDAVVIACTGRGPRLPYAGPATPIGHLIARAVRQALAASHPVNK
ncbi:MAG TPA: hypothetical protein ENK30_00460 [Anaerolineae bacterium]|nr:hypothetical protein [Anaerolineae bacterium]